LRRPDERDTLFARLSYEKGSYPYRAYYADNPGMLEIDDELRALSVCGPEGRLYDVPMGRFPESAFDLLADIRPLVDGPVSENRLELSPTDMTSTVKKAAIAYGGDAAGVAGLNESHYYSHRGRPSGRWGEPVEEILPFGVAIICAMDRGMIRKAPGVEEAVETTAAYARAALVSIILARSLRNMGYRARAHMDGDYLVAAGRVARDAGLGEFGRNSMLVTPRFGPCVRISVVSTDAPLAPDRATSFGVRDFCLHCGRCARKCPAGALAPIRNDEVAESDWKVDTESCYRQWSAFGSFCSLCVKNCPISYAGDRGLEGPLPAGRNEVKQYIEGFDAWLERNGE